MYRCFLKCRNTRHVLVVTHAYYIVRAAARRWSAAKNPPRPRTRADRSRSARSRRGYHPHRLSLGLRLVTRTHVRAEMNLRAVGVAVPLVALSTLAAATVDPPYDLRTEML